MCKCVISVRNRLLNLINNFALKVTNDKISAYIDMEIIRNDAD